MGVRLLNDTKGFVKSILVKTRPCLDLGQTKGSAWSRAKVHVTPFDLLITVESSAVFRALSLLFWIMSLSFTPRLLLTLLDIT